MSKKSFKKETKRAVLNILETEDSYMEPDEIMLKIQTQECSKIESIDLRIKEISGKYERKYKIRVWSEKCEVWSVKGLRA